MRRLALALVTTGLAATLAPPAQAFPPNAADRGCSAVLLSDPNPEAPDGTQTGVLTGGPVRQSGTLTCTIKVYGSTHDAPSNGAVAVAGGSGLTVLAPTLVSLGVPPGAPVYLCSRFHDGTTTYYWDGNADAWTTSASAPCERMNRADTSAINTVKRDVIDPVLCPVVATLHPYFYPSDPVYVGSDGDVYLLGSRVWDCAPYDTLPSQPYVEVYYHLDTEPHV